MASPTQTLRATRRLTEQQRCFVRAYAWEHKTKSEALRIAYRTRGDAHSVSNQAYHLSKTPHVAEAIARAENGDWDTLILVGVSPADLAEKTLYQMISNPNVPDYVRQRALVDVLEHRKREPEETTKMPDALDEIEQLVKVLQEQNGEGQEWDDLSLDDPPDPRPVQTKPAESRREGWAPAHPHLAQSREEARKQIRAGTTASLLKKGW